MLLLKCSSTPLLELSGKQKIVQSSGSSKQLIANMTEQQIQENGFEIEVTIPWVPDVFFSRCSDNRHRKPRKKNLRHPG